MTLFDPGPPEVTDETADLSADQRRTLRRREALAAGYHPTTGRKLLVAPEGVPPLTCGDCAHHVRNGGHARTYHKCARTPGGLTHGPGSDVRVSWPACDLFTTTTDPEGITT